MSTATEPSLLLTRSAIALALCCGMGGSMGCGAASPTSGAASLTSGGAAQFPAVPSGPVHYGADDVADAGFVQASVSSQPCGEGLLGVRVRIVNTGKAPFEMYMAQVSGRRANGDVVAPTRLPYDSPCKPDPHVAKLAPGEASTEWAAFAAEAAGFEVKVLLEEPSGLAEHVAMFHLDRAHVERDKEAAVRPLPPTPKLAGIEARYYRLTVVGARACSDTETSLVGYEVVFESFSNVPLALGSAELSDESGRRYPADFLSFDKCRIDTPTEVRPSEIAPGQKWRGWLPGIRVQRGAKSLVLHTDVRGRGLGSETVDLPLGAPPAAAPVPVAAAAAKKPDPLAALSANPPPAAGPVFRDLEPIPKDPTQYYRVKMLHLVRDGHVTQDNFFMAAVPITPELWAAAMYPKWAEKRYDAAKMADLTRAFATSSRTELIAQLGVFHHGDLFANGGEHSKTLPDDLAEYVFLEIEGMAAIRAREVRIPLMEHVIGAFSKQSTVELVFDLPAGAADRLARGPGQVKIVVGGLGFREKTMSYALPLSTITSDAPRELKALYRAALGAP